jgi:hypothetical protein
VIGISLLAYLIAGLISTGLFSYIAVSFMFFLVLYAFIGAPMILTIISSFFSIINYFRSNQNKKESNVYKLREIINDEIALKIFSQFCSSEFSIENLSIYLDDKNFIKKNMMIKEQPCVI